MPHVSKVSASFWTRRWSVCIRWAPLFTHTIITKEEFTLCGAAHTQQRTNCLRWVRLAIGLSDLEQKQVHVFCYYFRIVALEYIHRNNICSTADHGTLLHHPYGPSLNSSPLYVVFPFISRTTIWWACSVKVMRKTIGTHAKYGYKWICKVVTMNIILQWSCFMISINRW